MKILLWCHDLMNRMRLESAWKAVGVTMLKRNSTEVPDCIVVDLANSRALEQIRELRDAHPQVDIIAFGAQMDSDTFRQAQEAGATEIAASGSIEHRVTRRLSN